MRSGLHYPVPLQASQAQANNAKSAVGESEPPQVPGLGLIVRVTTNLALLWGPFLVSATSPRRAAFFHLRVHP